MKSERGVTLVALLTIVVILAIFMTIGIYSGVNSYKAMNFQKYKAQMQLIQNAVDELYEENKNNELQENTKNYYGNKVYNKDSKEIAQEVKSFWKEDIAKNTFGISLDSEEYYYLSAEEIESAFNLEDIDISEYFIINFEKKYVFSVTQTQVITKDAEGNELTEDIYCLYQLDDDEEKKVDFEIESSGEFEYNVIYKEDYKQIVEIIHDVNIEKVEVYIKDEDKYQDVKKRKDYCTKVSGLNTRKVTLEIVKDCKIKVTNVLGNFKEIEIQRYNVPVLEKNMVPIISKDKDNGKICYINDPKWYNYLIKDNKIDDSTNFATVVEVSEEYYYKENVSDTVENMIDLTKFTDIKVWIPKNLIEQFNNMYCTNYQERDFEGVGMWVETFWDDELKKYVPFDNYRITRKTIAEDGVNKYYITIEHRLNITAVEIAEKDKENYKDINIATEFCSDVSGLGGSQITFQILKDMKVKIKDENEREFVVDIKK